MAKLEERKAFVDSVETKTANIKDKFLFNQLTMRDFTVHI